MEETSIGLCRRSQIKTRLPILPNEFTPEYRIELKKRIDLMQYKQYTYGTNRFTYVAPDKLWRTSIFCNSETDGTRITFSVCDTIQDPFISGQGSFTYRILRKKIQQNNPQITKINNNTVKYGEPIPIFLSRAVVLLNGSEKPTLIWKNKKLDPNSEKRKKIILFYSMIEKKCH